MPNRLEGERSSFSVLNEAGRIIANFWSKMEPLDLHALASSTPPTWMPAYRPQLREFLSRGVVIKWGRHFIEYEETADRVCVRFDDGSVETCDLLVGCDGLRSSGEKALNNLVHSIVIFLILTRLSPLQQKFVDNDFHVQMIVLTTLAFGSWLLTSSYLSQS
jgi:hypothetical protein